VAGQLSTVNYAKENGTDKTWKNAVWQATLQGIYEQNVEELRGNLEGRQAIERYNKEGSELQVFKEVVELARESAAQMEEVYKDAVVKFREYALAKQAYLQEELVAMDLKRDLELVDSIDLDFSTES